MIRCPDGCNVVFSHTGASQVAGISTVHGKDPIEVRKKLQHHLWGKHNYGAMEAHLKAAELMGAEPARVRPGERTPR
jgi:hypothetical protein